jgi:hypothetical protein
LPKGLGELREIFKRSGAQCVAMGAAGGYVKASHTSSRRLAVSGKQVSPLFPDWAAGGLEFITTRPRASRTSYRFMSGRKPAQVHSPGESFHNEYNVEAKRKKEHRNRDPFPKKSSPSEEHRIYRTSYRQNHQSPPRAPHLFIDPHADGALSEGWTPSGYCNRSGCDRPPTAYQQRSTVADPEESPPSPGSCPSHCRWYPKTRPRG